MTTKCSALGNFFQQKHVDHVHMYASLLKTNGIKGLFIMKKIWQDTPEYQPAESAV